MARNKFSYLHMRNCASNHQKIFTKPFVSTSTAVRSWCLAHLKMQPVLNLTAL